MSADIEAQIRAVADAAFDQTSPVERDRYVAETSPAKHNWWLVAAASVLVFALMGALALINRSDDDATTTPAIQSDGDATIDPSRLRFAAPLADDTVAFFDNPTIPAPRVAPIDSVPASPGDSDELADEPDSVHVIVMDDATLLMRAIIIDGPDPGAGPGGPAVDIGIDGARYADAGEVSITIPLGDGVRLVAPAELFTFGGGGPYVEPSTLVDIATAIGDRPIDEIDDLDGFYVADATIDGERSGVLTADTVTVTHSESGEPDGVNTTIVRLQQTPTAQELVSIAHALTGGEIDTPALGDVTFTAGSTTYVELVSPVDLLLVTAPTALGDILDSLQFGPLAPEVPEVTDGPPLTPEAVRQSFVVASTNPEMGALCGFGWDSCDITEIRTRDDSVVLTLQIDENRPPDDLPEEVLAETNGRSAFGILGDEFPQLDYIQVTNEAGLVLADVKCYEAFPTILRCP